MGYEDTKLIQGFQLTSDQTCKRLEEEEKLLRESEYSWTIPVESVFPVWTSETWTYGTGNPMSKETSSGGKRAKETGENLEVVSIGVFVNEFKVELELCQQYCEGLWTPVRSSTP